ncbi:MAG TPA: hypothetical protein VJ547_08790 [Candidatus Thermoplasmatota archaeon]|nr:hypothetical protein [Candidatus Thermoplasmatota archaeon]
MVRVVVLAALAFAALAVVALLFLLPLYSRGVPSILPGQVVLSTGSWEGGGVNLFVAKAELASGTLPQNLTFVVSGMEGATSREFYNGSPGLNETRVAGATVNLSYYNVESPNVSAGDFVRLQLHPPSSTALRGGTVRVFLGAHQVGETRLPYDIHLESGNWTAGTLAIRVSVVGNLPESNLSQLFYDLEDTGSGVTYPYYSGSGGANLSTTGGVQVNISFQDDGDLRVSTGDVVLIQLDPPGATLPHHEGGALWLTIEARSSFSLRIQLPEP